MTSVSLKPISNSAIGAALLFASQVTTARNAGLFLCGRIIRTRALCRNGISRSISGSLKGKAKAEQVGLNSRVLHFFGQARSIMRQKRRKMQPENTVHKDMSREQLAREFTPDAAHKLRQLLEQNKRAREGDE